MKLSNTLITIRPRSLLESLDLAILIIGRFPIGILLSLAVGIIPCLLFNWWLLQDANSEQIGITLYFLLPLEIPLSTVFLTLYLGQMTFTRKFSIIQALHDLYTQSFQLFVYQVLLRGFMCLTFILFPVVCLGMYYMNEIILLEKGSFVTTWKRRRAFHDQRVGNIISSRFFELILFCMCFYMIKYLLLTLTALWNDQTNFNQIFPNDEMNAEELYYFINWQTSVAFFLAVGLIRVYRFVMYIDNRIRYEGWDVELKLLSISQAYRS